MSKFNQYLTEQLKDSAFKAEYDALEAEFAIIHAMITARQKTGMTQKQIAERTGIHQSDISKLERGNGNPSLRTLSRLAEGLGMKLKVEFTSLAGR